MLPLAFGLWAYALAFTALNAAILFVRIRAENAALASGVAASSLNPSPSHDLTVAGPPAPFGRGQYQSDQQVYTSPRRAKERARGAAVGG